MAVDEALLEAAAAEGQSTLRFYRWAEPTLSLGYFQTYGDRCQHEASRGCAVIRRPSGGGAILHDRELTYSLVVPARHPLANRDQLYRAVHQSLIEVLAARGAKASFCGGEMREATTAAASEPLLCFERRTECDVLVAGGKIAGSAQRRRRGAVLQHGSVLLRRSPAAPQLPGLLELAGLPLSSDELAERWLGRLSAALRAEWHSAPLTPDEENLAAELVERRYASRRWTENRETF